MNQDQRNLREMFGTVDQYLEINSSLWSEGAAFAKAVVDLKSGISAIDKEAAKQAKPITGMTGVKRDARDELEDATQEIGDQLAALAAANEDPDLAAKVLMTRSSIDQAAGSDLLIIAKRVAELATVNLAALADYSITAADVADLQAAIKRFEPLKDTPRVAVVGRAGSTATLPTLISATRGILRNRLDKLMTRFRRSQPQFYAGYLSARVIVGRGGNGGAEGEDPTPPAA